MVRALAFEDGTDIVLNTILSILSIHFTIHPISQFLFLHTTQQNNKKYCYLSLLSNYLFLFTHNHKIKYYFFSLQLMNSKVAYIRLVHGSVWVGFVPNPEPARLLRIYHFWTRHWPVKGVGLGGRTSPQTDRFSVGVESCKTLPKFAEIHQSCTKSSRIWWDLAGSRWDLAWSWRNLTESRWNLVGSRRDLAISWLIGLKPPVKRSYQWKMRTFSGVIRSDQFFSGFHVQIRQLTLFKYTNLNRVGFYCLGS